MENDYMEKLITDSGKLLDTTEVWIDDVIKAFQSYRKATIAIKKLIAKEEDIDKIARAVQDFVEQLDERALYELKFNDSRFSGLIDKFLAVIEDYNVWSNYADMKMYSD